MNILEELFKIHKMISLNLVNIIDYSVRIQQKNWGTMIQKIDGIEFKIKEPYDFGFLGEYGKVFKVFDDQDSGNICFGTDKDGQKYLSIF